MYFPLIRAMRPADLIHLDLITRVMSDEDHEQQRSKCVVLLPDERLQFVRLQHDLETQFWLFFFIFCAERHLQVPYDWLPFSVRYGRINWIVI